MKISIITVFPHIFEPFLNTSLISRAISKGIIDVNLVKLSDFVPEKSRIDEPTCGPGAGMIIKPDVIQDAIKACEKKWGNGYKIFFSPQGEKLDQKLLKQLANKFFVQNLEKTEQKKEERIQAKTLDHIILICSRYEGIDERVLEFYADLQLSIGDYVLMDGDLPAQVFLEGVLRYLPGVVGKVESVEEESFSGSFLDHPEYGLPKEWNGLKIPEVVLSGNHAEIEKYRKEKAAQKTVESRFDWFVSSNPTIKDIKLAKKFIPNHYSALMHTQILVKDDVEGNNSITSLDIHDIARSSSTYGIKNYFMVTPLEDQKKILNTFLDFWRSKEGQEYNKNRFDAVSLVRHANNFDDVINCITKKEGVKPLVIATSARSDVINNLNKKPAIIDFYSQDLIFKQQKPILMVFGTAKGLASSVLQKCDYLLIPIDGITDYNHLSVRSAAAIIFDRWLGLKGRVVD